MHTAEADPIIVRETDTTRWVFRPLLVDNAKSPNASVRGSLVYQRKKKGGEWEDIRGETLTRLKSGEGIAVHLSSAEVLRLFTGIADLYAIHAEHGTPTGEHTFVSAEESLKALPELEDEEIEALRELGEPALQRLLRWALGQDELVEILDKLEITGPKIIRDLSIAAGLQSLESAVGQWDSNQDNCEEEFWHTMLLETSLLLEQLFSFPVILVRDKAYIGGKSFDNSGGSVVDFLAKNRLTQNAVLIEIKTPCAKLLGSEYRGAVFPPSREVMGGVTQLLDYRRVFSRKIDGIAMESGEDIESCDPPCLLLVGNAQVELDSEGRRRSFELVRRQFPGLDIVTFDELFERTDRLISLLRGGGPVEEGGAS